MEPTAGEFKSYGPIGPVVGGRELIGFFKATDDDAPTTMYRALRRTIEAGHVGPNGADTGFWRGHFSEIAEGLVITGHPDDPQEAVSAVEKWAKRGVTHVLDCRAETDDRELFVSTAPWITYRHLGVRDDGSLREDAWWEEGLEFAQQAASEGGTLLVSHICNLQIAFKRLHRLQQECLHHHGSSTLTDTRDSPHPPSLGSSWSDWREQTNGRQAHSPDRAQRTDDGPTVPVGRPGSR